MVLIRGFPQGKIVFQILTILRSFFAMKIAPSVGFRRSASIVALNERLNALAFTHGLLELLELGHYLEIVEFKKRHM